jgi:hypothetical protein
MTFTEKLAEPDLKGVQSMQQFNPLGNLTDWQALRTSDDYLKYGFMCLGTGIWLLGTSVLGFLDVSLKGHFLFGFWLKSTPIRIVCFVLAIGFLIVATYMFRQLLSSIHNS